MNDKTQHLTMDDIAGYGKEKAELRAIIDIFNAYENYVARGAYLPKGLILSGPPGVGKTLFAKVLADEINAPFFYMDGTQYDTTKGVQKLRAIFAKARSKAPAVVFIDELNTFVGDDDYETDYTKRNLSALLKLIDGLNGADGVFVIGASSDKNGLDGALLRSGRMDKHICLNQPDASTRAAILDYYLSKSDLDYSAVDRKAVVAKTAGLNGADIKTLVNEVALTCIYRDVAPDDEIFSEQICKIAKKDIVREKTLDGEGLLAIHDLGHLLVSRELLHVFAPVSVRYDVPDEGNSSIDFLCDKYADEEDEWEDEDDEWDDEDEDKWEDEDEDKWEDEDEEAEEAWEGRETISLHAHPEEMPSDDATRIPYSVGTHVTLEDLLNCIAVMLGGKAAEEVVLGETFNTSKDDIHAAQAAVEDIFDNGLLGFAYANLRHLYHVEISQELLAAKERKRTEILTEEYERAKGIIARYVEVFPVLHAALCERKTLSVAEVERILQAHVTG